MANQSEKKNQQNIKPTINLMSIVVYVLCSWALLTGLYRLFFGEMGYWHMGFLLLVGWLSIFCLRQTVKCWELQLPSEASEYYLDVLFINAIVLLVDPFTSKVWYGLIYVQVCLPTDFGISAMARLETALGLHYPKIRN